MTVTVNDGMCTIEQNDKEADLTKLNKTLTFPQAKAAHTKASIVESQLPVLRAGIEKDKEKLASLAPGTAAWEKLRRKRRSSPSTKTSGMRWMRAPTVGTTTRITPSARITPRAPEAAR